MQSISDRRLVTAVIGALVVLLGAAMIAVWLLALWDPTAPAAEGGPPTDVTRVLAAAIALGVLLVLAGLSTAIGLVRAQLRKASGATDDG